MVSSWISAGVCWDCGASPELGMRQASWSNSHEMFLNDYSWEDAARSHLHYFIFSIVQMTSHIFLPIFS